MPMKNLVRVKDIVPILLIDEKEIKLTHKGGKELGTTNRDQLMFCEYADYIVHNICAFKDQPTELIIVESNYYD